MLSLIVRAQDVSGFWKGTLTMKSGCFAENNIELQIKIAGQTVTGTSYQYLDANNYIKKDLKGTYNKVEQSLTLQEGSVTTYNIPSHCFICVKKYQLNYSRTGKIETLSGGWTGVIRGSTEICQPGTIVLSRTNDPFQEPPQIKVDTGTIRLDFYDNGEIDGDSITVKVNGQVVLSHQRLGVKPITIYVKADLHQPFQQVEMIAENLGSIPPNTALLIVTAGKKRYRLFLTSTQSKTASVRFVYNNEVEDKTEDKLLR